MEEEPKKELTKQEKAKLYQKEYREKNKDKIKALNSTYKGRYTAWHKENYQNKKEEYKERARTRQAQIKKAIQILNEQGVKLQEL